jgi:hypothetical protein
MGSAGTEVRLREQPELPPLAGAVHSLAPRYRFLGRVVREMCNANF